MLVIDELTGGDPFLWHGGLEYFRWLSLQLPATSTSTQGPILGFAIH